jgi:hypothetical protein
MKVFIVNEADNFHSLNSFRLVGVASSLEKGIAMIQHVENNEGKNLPIEAIKQLREIRQTQGLKGGFQYNIKEVTLNEIV